MTASLDLSNALGGSGSAAGGDINGLAIFTIALVLAGLGVLAAIAIANWRASKVLKTARKHWASTQFGPSQALENQDKPNPLRRMR